MLLFTPGPTPIPESIRQAMAIPTLHHRTKEFEGYFEFCRIKLIELIKMQDVLYGRHSRDQVIQYIKNGYGQDIEIDEELIRDIGFCYCSDEDIYFENEELLNKHLKYKNRESNLEK